jgi:hypothetical protein
VSSSWGYPYYQYGIEFDGNGAKTLDFYFRDTSGTLRGPFSLNPTLRVWTHMAFTYDGTVVKGYVDGVQKISLPSRESIQVRGNEMRLGIDAAFGQASKGELDQVQVYTRALTASEIQAAMNSSIK